MRIIIVDDEACWRAAWCGNTWKNMRTPRSWPNAPTAFEAVKAITELAPDLVFLDIQMPKLDGFEVAELAGRQGALYLCHGL